MMVMSEDFLSRWSRRKRRLEEPPAADEPKPPVPVAEEDADEDVITPEELAALPAVEEITASTDLVAFLRKGVPAALRNAALRRAWVLDPAIRDFVGDARDYAWDWNTPGGVPCSGPLDEGTDIAGMVRRILGEGEPEKAVETAKVHGNVTLPESSVQNITSPAPDAQKAESDDAKRPTNETDAEQTIRRKTHGGALPG